MLLLLRVTSDAPGMILSIQGLVDGSRNNWSRCQCFYLRKRFDQDKGEDSLHQDMLQRSLAEERLVVPQPLLSRMSWVAERHAKILYGRRKPISQAKLEKSDREFTRFVMSWCGGLESGREWFVSTRKMFGSWNRRDVTSVSSSGQDDP